MTDHQRRKLARRIVRKILDNLSDRRGFRQEWDGTGQQTKKEIRHHLQVITLEELRRGDLE